MIRERDNTRKAGEDRRGGRLEGVEETKECRKEGKGKEGLV